MDELRCPITHVLMKDPVLTPSGVSFERNAIERWVEENQTDPFTRERLDKADLVPNRALRSLIQSMQNTAAVVTRDEPNAVNVVFAIDVSGSMRDKCAGVPGVEGTHELALIDAVYMLLEHILKTLVGKNVNVCILAFSDRVTPISSMKPLTSETFEVNKRRMKAAFSRAAGATNLLAAVCTSLDIISRLKSDDISYVFVITDGDPTVPGTVEETWNITFKGIENALKFHEGRVPTVHAVAIGEACNHDNLRKVAVMCREAQIVSETRGKAPHTRPRGAFWYIKDTTTMGPALVKMATLLMLKESRMFQAPIQTDVERVILRLLDSTPEGAADTRAIAEELKQKATWYDQLDRILNAPDRRSRLLALLESVTIGWPTSRDVADPTSFVVRAYPDTHEAIMERDERCLHMFNITGVMDRSLVLNRGLKRSLTMSNCRTFSGIQRTLTCGDMFSQET